MARRQYRVTEGYGGKQKKVERIRTRRLAVCQLFLARNANDMAARRPRPLKLTARWEMLVRT
jgi:hypothetical protein